LLKEAGYADGFTVNIMLITGGSYADFGALLADQLKPLKIDMKMETVDYAGAWIPRSTNGEFELSNMNHVYNMDPDSLLSTHFHSEGGRNYGKFNDPVYDDLVVKQQRATNLEERKKLAQQAEQRLFDQAPMIFLYRGSRVVLAQPWTHNVSLAPISGSDASNAERVWLDKR